MLNKFFKLFRGSRVSSNKVEEQNDATVDEISQERKRLMLRPEFTYHFIPFLAYNVYTGELDIETSIEILLDKESIIRMAGNTSFSLDGFDVQEILHSSVSMILYIFPDHNESSGAKFAMLTMNLEKKDFISYYTLEKMNNNEWLLGGIDVIKLIKEQELDHFNFGKVQYEPTVENFKQDVFMRLSEHVQSMNLYNFTYHFIPYLANEVYTGKLSPEALTDKEWIMKVAGNTSFSWNGFDIENILTGSVCVLLYILPEPKESTEAKFAILIIDIEKKDFISYYTLEKMYNGEWLLGGIDIIEQSHLNFGKVQYEPTAENFKQDIYKRLSDKGRVPHLACTVKCSQGHFHHKDEKECPYCIARNQVFQQIDTYKNALMETYLSAYKEEELRKRTDLEDLFGQYGYIFHKASVYLLNGADEYSYNDYFHYPLAEWNRAKLKSGCEQWVQTKGVTEQQYIEDLTQNEIRDLFELFHYTLLKVEPTFKERVSKIIFQHKFTKKECFVFCQLI